MNAIRAIGRSAAILASLIAAALLTAIAGAPDAFAAPLRGGPRPALPYPVPPHAHAAVAGATPGWQIALIVAGAILVAATIGLLERARGAQRRVSTTAA